MMPYLRIDDQFCDHPKILAAGPLAGWLHVCGLTYCARLLTDGFIPAAQLRKLADIDEVTPLVTRLVAAGLWDECDGGYRIHDYLDYNPSAEQVKRDRARNAERQARFRERTATIYGGNAVSNALRDEPRNAATNGAPPHPIPPSGGGVGGEGKEQEESGGEEAGHPVTEVTAVEPGAVPEPAPTPPALSSDALDEMHAVLSRFQDRGYVVDQRFYAKVSELYPRLDVALEALKLADWLKEPKNRRERCTARRVLNWLARAEEDRLRRLAEREQVRSPAVNLNGAAPKPYVPLPPPELPTFTPEQEKASDAARERVAAEIRAQLAKRGLKEMAGQIGGLP